MFWCLLYPIAKLVLVRRERRIFDAFSLVAKVFSMLTMILTQAWLSPVSTNLTESQISSWMLRIIEINWDHLGFKDQFYLLLIFNVDKLVHPRWATQWIILWKIGSILKGWHKQTVNLQGLWSYSKTLGGFQHTFDQFNASPDQGLS